MPISPLNFFWLTDPHDLQGMPASIGDHLVGAKLPTSGRIEFIQRVLHIRRILERVLPESSAQGTCEMLPIELAKEIVACRDFLGLQTSENSSQLVQKKPGRSKVCLG
jgi:hypothetical protein